MMSFKNRKGNLIMRRVIPAVGLAAALIIGAAVPATATTPTVEVSIAAGQGTVARTVAADGWVQLSAQPADGYKFAGLPGQDAGGWLGGSSRVRSSLVATTTFHDDGSITAGFPVQGYNVHVQALFIRLADAPEPIIVPGETVYLDPVDLPGAPEIIVLPGPITQLPTAVVPGGGAPAATAPGAAIPPIPPMDDAAGDAAGDEVGEATAPADNLADEVAVPELPITGGYDADAEAPALAITGADEHHFEDADAQAATAVIATGAFLVGAIVIVIASRLTLQKTATPPHAQVPNRNIHPDTNVAPTTGSLSGGKFSNQTPHLGATKANEQHNAADRVLINR